MRHITVTNVVCVIMNWLRSTTPTLYNYLYTIHVYNYLLYTETILSNNGVCLPIFYREEKDTAVNETDKQTMGGGAQSSLAQCYSQKHYILVLCKGQ